MLDQAGAIKAKYKTNLSQKIVRIDFKIGLSAGFFFYSDFLLTCSPENTFFNFKGKTENLAAKQPKKMGKKYNIKRKPTFCISYCPFSHFF